MAVQEGNEKEQVIKELEKQIRLTESVNSGWVHLTIEFPCMGLRSYRTRYNIYALSVLPDGQVGNARRTLSHD